MKTFIGVILILLSGSRLIGQSSRDLKYPIAGQPCPDFIIRNIENFPEKEIKPKGSIRSTALVSKGKWTILDFWNKGCTSCIQSFPKMNKLNEKFRDRINFILIGLEDKQEQIRPMFATFKAKLGLTFPFAFDSLLFARLDILTAPHILIIDPKGIVRAVTGSVNEQQVTSLLRGEPTQFSKTYYRMSEEGEEEKKAIKFDQTEPFLSGDNGGNQNDFMYRSLFARWNPNMPKAGGAANINQLFKETYNNGTLRNYTSLQILGTSLENLYVLAFFGNHFLTEEESKAVCAKPVLELKDTSAFACDYATGNGYYCYSLILPKFKASPSLVKTIMQVELQATFGYEAALERRQVPCFKLICIDSSALPKLRAKGDSTYFHEVVHNAHFIAKNLPITKLLNWLEVPGFRKPKLNFTGLTGNIDIDFDGLKTDYAQIRSALQKVGLDLVEATNEMTALVIRDRKPIEYKQPSEAVNNDDAASLVDMFRKRKPTKEEVNSLFTESIQGNASECFKLLLQEGADINFSTKYIGMTPLMVACDFGRLSMVQALLARGADKDVIYHIGTREWLRSAGYDGLTLMGIAKLHKYTDLEAYLKGINIK